MNHSTLLMDFVRYCRENRIKQRGISCPIQFLNCRLNRFPKFDPFKDVPSIKVRQAIRLDAPVQVEILREISGDTDEAILGFAMRESSKKIITLILSKYVDRQLSSAEIDFVVGFWLETRYPCKIDLNENLYQRLVDPLLQSYRDEIGNNFLWYLYLRAEHSERGFWHKYSEIFINEYGLEPLECNKFGISAFDLQEEITRQKREGRAVRIARDKANYQNRYCNIHGGEKTELKRTQIK